MATKIEALPVKVFTRENPVTKVDIHNAFATHTGYVPSPVVQARGHIGINAIKHLKKQGYAVEVERSGVDYWQLTADGEAWLRKGLARHLELHPEAAELVRFPHAPAVKTKRVRRLTYSPTTGRVRAR